jgi:copper transport protein
MKKTRLLAIAAALILCLSLALPVFAHAVLVRSVPEANAVLKTAPAQIELFFSEQLDPTFSAISVFSADGALIDNKDARVDASDPTHMVVSLPSLPDGIYTVSWKALSATDGHLTTGAFPFAVGNADTGALAAAGQTSRQIKISTGEIAAKWLVYLGIAVLIGGTLFVLTIWQPVYQALKESTMSFNAPWRTLAAIGLVVLVAGDILALLVQAGQASGGEIAFPWSAATGAVLFNTRFGSIWLARLVLSLGLASLLPSAHRARERWIAIGLGILLALTVSLGSHAAAEPQPWLPVAADTVHLLAASVWVGGLSHFVIGLYAARQFDARFRTQLTARLIPRFSALGLSSVGLLTLTGLYSAVLRLGSWDALNNTLYGRVLITKLIIALPMVAMGAVNLLGITPAMKRAAAAAGNEPLVIRFRNLITSEISLGVALLLSVGLLTSLPPAQAASSAPGFDETQTVDDLAMELNITPGRVGLNTFTLTVTAGGQPIFNTKDVRLKFTPASGKLPPSEVSLSASGSGQYSLKGSNLSLPDTWQVQALVRREGKFFDAYANYSVTAGAANTGIVYPWNRIAGGLLLAAALIYLDALSNLGQTRRQWIGFGIIPALGIAAASILVFYQPPAADRGAELVNPIPPNADSVAKGQALFQKNCVPCHGQTGLGDGPVGLTLSPRPANLQLHAVPGVHTDGQLYLWISDGFPGSVMPAFRGSLADEERWNLVNYIRTLAPKK